MNATALSPMPSITPRVAFAAIFATCMGLLGFGLYMQHFMGLEPCPMCILQRVAFIAVGLVALGAAIHGPNVTGTRIYSGIAALFALTGAGIATRHSFLQRFPDPSTSCGVELEFLLDNFPLTQAVPKIFAGTGECAKVTWRFLGLSTPEWSLVWFLLLAGAAAWVALRKPS